MCAPSGLEIRARIHGSSVVPLDQAAPLTELKGRTSGGSNPSLPSRDNTAGKQRHPSKSPVVRKQSPDYKALQSPSHKTEAEENPREFYYLLLHMLSVTLGPCFPECVFQSQLAHDTVVSVGGTEHRDWTFAGLLRRPLVTA